MNILNRWAFFIASLLLIVITFEALIPDMPWPFFALVGFVWGNISRALGLDPLQSTYDTKEPCEHK